MRPFAIALAACFSVVFCDAAARADAVPRSPELPARLTMAESLRVFRSQGLDLLIADAAVRSAEGSVEIAGAVPNPAWSATTGFAPTYRHDDPSCRQSGARCAGRSYGIGVSDSAAIEDSLAGKRDLRLKVARAALAAAKMSRADAQRTLEFQVRSTYLAVAQAAAAYRFAARTAASNVVSLEKFRTRFAAGAITAGDLARMQTQKLESEQAVAQAEQGLRQARAALAFLLGVRGWVSDFDVDADALAFAPRAAIASATEESLLRLALAHRPDLIAVGYATASSRAAVDLAKRQVMPDVQVSIGYSWGAWGGAGTGAALAAPPTLAAGVSGTLPAFYQLEGEIRQAAAQLDANALSYAKAVAQVANDVATAVAVERAAREIAARMEGPAGLLASAKTAFEITAIQYDKGAAKLTDYLDAYRAYVATQFEEYQDLTNYSTAVHQLEQAVGMEIR